uniref:Uncharacterized protein n=1 Tax=Mycena chlorophos TaxID=658473 RepID=A0ABQ0L3H7_MYCCL|nr:predicted protein [Mycena chlorophos]
MSSKAARYVAEIETFPPSLPINQPPALSHTPRTGDGVKTPLYLLGWLVPRNHLWSLKFNGREWHYDAPDFMDTVIEPLFKSRFPKAKDVPTGLSFGSFEYAICLAFNKPERTWLDEQQAEIVQFVKETLQLPNEPKWYRTPLVENMLPDFHAVWPTAYQLKYTKGESDQRRSASNLSALSRLYLLSTYPARSVYTKKCNLARLCFESMLECPAFGTPRYLDQ